MPLLAYSWNPTTVLGLHGRKQGHSKSHVLRSKSE